MSHHEEHAPRPSQGDKLKLLVIVVASTFAAAMLVKIVGDMFLGHH